MQEFIQKFWLETILSAVVALAGTSIKLSVNRIKKEVEEQKELKGALLALLHDRLYQACNHFIKLDHITAGELNNLEHLYTAYHGLGGNGTGTELYNRCKSLEIRTEMETTREENAY